MSQSILMVIAPDQFRDEELHAPREIFKNYGWQVDTVSTKTGDIKGMLGATETVTKTLDDVDAKTYDAIVVVGGMGSPEYLYDNTQLHAMLNAVSDNAKVVSSICLSGAVLAKAGLLKGKTATVWPDETAIQILKDNGANYTEEACVTDGKIVTANGPETAKAFGQAVSDQVRELAAV